MIEARDSYRSECFITKFTQVSQVFKVDFLRNEASNIILSFLIFILFWTIESSPDFAGTTKFSIGVYRGTAGW